ncbi:hypothetical protein [Gemmatimonas sp.]|jgi:DNA topoisomerase-1
MKRTTSARPSRVLLKRNKTRGQFRKCLMCGNEWDVARPDEAEDVAEVA